MLAAGGTGGHIFPAQALAAELGRRGRTVDIVTDWRGGDFGNRFPGQTIHRVASATLSGRGALGKILALARIALGTLQARRLIRRLNPAAVIGFGGYPSLPTMLAAISLSVPRAVHEQNAVLGRVNRLIAARVDAIAISFPATRGLSRTYNLPKLLTGNPVRGAVLALAETAYQAPSAAAPFNLLVFGGSQGARRFSEIVPRALLALAPDQRRRMRVVQQCRAEDIETVRRIYAEAGIAAETAAFFDDLPARLGAAHLVIARSGAGTVSELAVAGRPSILVPYSHATDDHQTGNAMVLCSAGGAWLLPEADLTESALAAQLTKLMLAPDLLDKAARAARGRARPHAAAALADLVLVLAGAGVRGRAAA